VIKLRESEVRRLSRFGWQFFFAARPSSVSATKRNLLLGAERCKFSFEEAIPHKRCTFFIAQGCGDPAVPGDTVFAGKLVVGHRLFAMQRRKTIPRVVVGWSNISVGLSASLISLALDKKLIIDSAVVIEENDGDLVVML